MKKLLIILLITCVFCVLALAQDKQVIKTPEQIASVVSNTKVTGIVTLNPNYINRTRSKITKNSAIVNDRIMIEGIKYTLNEKTFKITTRTIYDQKEYNGGAFIGGAYIIANKIENNIIYFKYSHSVFSEVVEFTKNLKK